MGKYEAPTCDCGEPLLYYQEISYAVTNNITKSGVPSKKTKEKYTLNCTEPCLKCEECLTMYEIEYNEKKQIKKGKNTERN